MDTQHRKIELQSPSDLAFLTAQLRTAARQKLDLHLPAVSDSAEPDDLRHHVESLVDAFVTQILASMRSNISINGMEVESAPRANDDQDASAEILEFEPFDDKLRARVGSAIARRDMLIGKISAHRRETGEQSARAWRKAWEEEEEEEEGMVVLGEAHQSGGGLDDGHVADLTALEREDELSRTWERAVQGLARLDTGLPETRARLERAGEVVGYLVGK
ncbi:hypothetical protein ACEQ8H_008677 [Pleosporales sp. CAS-2024a]